MPETKSPTRVDTTDRGVAAFCHLMEAFEAMPEVLQQGMRYGTDDSTEHNFQRAAGLVKEAMERLDGPAVDGFARAAGVYLLSSAKGMVYTDLDAEEVKERIARAALGTEIVKTTHQRAEAAKCREAEKRFRAELDAASSGAEEPADQTARTSGAKERPADMPREIVSEIDYDVMNAYTLLRVAMDSRTDDDEHDDGITNSDSRSDAMLLMARDKLRDAVRKIEPYS